MNLRHFSYGVIFYMLIAFSWWTILLFIQTRDAFEAKSQLLRMGMAAEKIYDNEDHFLQTAQYQALVKKYKRQEFMIVGEALAFICSLVFGIWMINRGYKHQVEAAQQSRNFLLSVTHELKSPLASIRLVLETFLKRQLTPEQLHRLSNNGLRETDRLTTLVNDLLLAAKVETAYQPQFEEIDLRQIIIESVAPIEEKNPKVQFELDAPNFPVLLQLDRQGMVSVIQNLVENAIKYGGEIPQVSIMLAKKDNKTFLSIADNGIGISDTEKKKVFEKFYRVGSEDTRTTKGTGLGLYIVQEILKAHQAKISIADNAPKGTVFRIVF
jgi:signal transduction histidine kinase